MSFYIEVFYYVTLCCLIGDRFESDSDLVTIGIEAVGGLEVGARQHIVS